jgi:uncharacterized protein YqhQ
MESVPAILTAADGSSSLPRLGGMARPQGVVIVSRRFWALARTDGALVEGEMPRPPAFLQRIPVVRGLVRLALALAPLGGARTSRDRPELPLLVACFMAPLALAFLPPRPQLAAGVLLSLALIVWIMRGRTLFLHGAEHRAIEASETRQLVATWDGEARPSRYSRRCGTNFAALALLTMLAAYIWLPGAQGSLWSLPLGIAALGLTMELWFLIQAMPSAAGTVLLAPGLALQRLTTREPDPQETRLALRAVASVLERELTR